MPYFCRIILVGGEDTCTKVFFSFFEKACTKVMNKKLQGLNLVKATTNNKQIKATIDGGPFENFFLKKKLKKCSWKMKWLRVKNIFQNVTYSTNGHK